MSMIIACDPANYAVFLAVLKFSGRDRRRIKREVNKAWRRVRRKDNR